MYSKLTGLIFICILVTNCMTMDMREVEKVQTDHDTRIRFLEEWVGGLNEEISLLQQIIRASEGKDQITSVTPTAEGLTISFRYNPSITIRHGAKGEQGADGQPGQDGTDGKDGTDGTDGQKGDNAPSMGVQKIDGCYFWTLTTNGSTTFLTDANGKKLPVTGIKGETGKDGQPGVDGQPGITPVLSISPEGNWLINGQEIIVNGLPLPATGPTGDPGPDGLPGNGGNGAESSTFFQAIDLQTDNVTFTLKDGSTFTLPICEELAFNLTVPALSYRLKENETRQLSYTAKAIHNITVTGPEGWQVTVDTLKKQISVTAPSPGHLHAAREGILSVLASNGKGQQIIVNRYLSLILLSYRIDLSLCHSSGTDVYLVNTPEGIPVAEICYEYVKGYTEKARQRSLVVYPWNPKSGDYTTGFVVANGGQVNHDGSGYLPGNSAPVQSIGIDISGELVPVGETQLSLTPQTETITDPEGNNYGIVKIGNQYWMKENYRCTHYRLEDGTLEELEYPKDYDAYEPGSEAVFGWLYDYAKIFHKKEKSSAFLPEGWHLPKSKEITELLHFIPHAQDLRAVSVAWTPAVNHENTNLSGFGALPGGYINTNISSHPHYGLHSSGEYWSSTEQNGVKNPVLQINYNTDNYTIKLSYNYAEQRSIRCIRDNWKR